MSKVVEIRVEKFRCRGSKGLFKFWKRYDIDIKMEDGNIVDIVTYPRMSEEQLEFVKSYVTRYNIAFKSLTVSSKNLASL